MKHHLSQKHYLKQCIVDKDGACIAVTLFNGIENDHAKTWLFTRTKLLVVPDSCVGVGIQPWVRNQDMIWQTGQLHDNTHFIDTYIRCHPPTCTEPWQLRDNLRRY